MKTWLSRDAAEYMQLQGVQNLIKNLHFTAEQAINALGTAPYGRSAKTGF